MKVLNVAVPACEQHSKALPRLLRLTLTDGAAEYRCRRLPPPLHLLCRSPCRELRWPAELLMRLMRGRCAPAQGHRALPSPSAQLGDGARHQAADPAGGVPRWVPSAECGASDGVCTDTRRAPRPAVPRGGKSSSSLCCAGGRWLGAQAAGEVRAGAADRGGGGECNRHRPHRPAPTLCGLFRGQPRTCAGSPTAAARFRISRGGGPRGRAHAARFTAGGGPEGGAGRAKRHG